MHLVGLAKSCESQFSSQFKFTAAGRQVLIPAPYWTSYPEMARMAEAEPVILETSQAEGYLLAPAQLEAALTPRARVLILCTPSNPTGTVYDEPRLRVRPWKSKVTGIVDPVWSCADTVRPRAHPQLALQSDGLRLGLGLTPIMSGRLFSQQAACIDAPPLHSLYSASPATLDLSARSNHGPGCPDGGATR